MFLISVVICVALSVQRCEAVCCPNCKHHPKGEDFSRLGWRTLEDGQFKKRNASEMWNEFKYFGPYCTLNTCDQTVSPLLNRCPSTNNVFRNRVIQCS